MKTCFLLAVLVTVSATGEDKSFQVTCQSFGRDFTCTSIGAENLKIYPHWILYTKHRMESFALSFTARAPKRWTLLVTNFYDYDTGIQVQSCVEVALIDGRAKFREPCTKP